MTNKSQLPPPARLFAGSERQDAGAETKWVRCAKRRSAVRRALAPGASRKTAVQAEWTLVVLVEKARPMLARFVWVGRRRGECWVVREYMGCTGKRTAQELMDGTAAVPVLGNALLSARLPGAATLQATTSQAGPASTVACRGARNGETSGYRRKCQASFSCKA